MTMTPEAKSAKVLQRQNWNHPCANPADMVRIIAEANAEYYLPLLRKWEPNCMSMSDLGEIHEEIRRLESAKGNA